MKKGKDGIYNRYIKRVLGFVICFITLIVLSPLMLALIILGAIAMRGNPFFVQMRPGRINKKTGQEKMFRLIKFRTMSNKRDKDGNLLPDEQRLNRYGRLLRKTSLDELCELINILKGDMSIVGPRPLLTDYLPYYTEQEHHRHDVRPGLTGWAQVNGRNNIRSWEERFANDVYYVNNVSFCFDIRILLMTVTKVASQSDIYKQQDIGLQRFDIERQKQLSQADS